MEIIYFYPSQIPVKFCLCFAVIAVITDEAKLAFLNGESLISIKAIFKAFKQGRGPSGPFPIFIDKFQSIFT